MSSIDLAFAEAGKRRLALDGVHDFLKHIYLLVLVVDGKQEHVADRHRLVGIFHVGEVHRLSQHGQRDPRFQDMLRVGVRNGDI
jgi:hypothetical protein